MEDERKTSFLSWLGKHGSNISNIAIEYSSISGFGVVSAVGIPKEEPIVSIPRNILLDATAALNEPILGEQLSKITTNFDIAFEVVAVASLLVWEYAKGKYSTHEPYVSLLPKTGGMDLSHLLPKEELNEMSLVKYFKERRRNDDEILKRMHNLFKSISDSCPMNISVDALNDSSIQCWAVDMYHSRAISVPVPSQDSMLNGPYSALVPMIDLFNHSFSATTSHSMQTNESKSHVVLVAGTSIGGAQNVFINYGVQEPQKMLIRYGFVPESKVHQVNLTLKDPSKSFPILNDCYLPFGLMDSLRQHLRLSSTNGSKKVEDAQEGGDEMGSSEGGAELLEKLYGYPPFSFDFQVEEEESMSDKAFFQLHEMGTPYSYETEKETLEYLLSLVQFQRNTIALGDSLSHQPELKRLFHLDGEVWLAMEETTQRLLRILAQGPIAKNKMQGCDVADV